METLALVLGGLLTVLCVLFVARPLLRSGKDDALVASGSAEDARVRLYERRDRALAALKELEFDHRTGKVSDEDYGALVGPLRREAAEALKALESEEREEGERARVDVGR
ncbi:MAG: c-type cytochrome biogenesis protein CcmI [Gaiellaceae bacterium]